MATLRKLGLLAVALLAASLVAATCWHWNGVGATRLSMAEALAVLRDPRATRNQRRSAVAMLTVHCRLAIREMKRQEDLREEVFLLLESIRKRLDE